MADVIRYDTVKIKHDADRVEKCITDIRRELQNLESNAQELDAMWDGEGSEAFKAVFHDDIETLTAVIEELSGIYRYEIKAVGKFDNCNKAVAELLASMG